MTQELLSALDVTNRVFRRTLRGYDVAEVDEFLDAVSDTIHIYAERVRECEATIGGLKEQMQEYQNLRESMQEALIMAQKSAEERIGAAEQQAQTVLGDARSKAESIVQQAHTDAEGIRREMKQLREKRSSMLAELRGFLARFEALLENQGEDEPSSKAPETPEAFSSSFSSSSTFPSSSLAASSREPSSSEGGDSLKIPPPR
jgi:cell division initiation protein